MRAVRENYLALAGLARHADTGAVVKADAYGHGAIPVAETLLQAGCRTFFVAYPHEGVELRERISADTARIFVFNSFLETDAETCAAFGLIPVLNSWDDTRIWSRTAPLNPFAVHIDTGMNRLGFRPEEAEAVADWAAERPLELVMSHLACADTFDHPKNSQQRDAFIRAAACFGDVPKSLSATAGVYLGPDYHFDLVRPGIGLHGGGPKRPDLVKLDPALTVSAPILRIADVKAGESIGYGASFTAKSDLRVATLAMGYADGFLRSGSNYGFTSLRGVPCPVLGRVSMDLICIDVTDCADQATPGTMVEVLGPQVDLEIQAEALGTLGYELTTRLGGRICRSWTGQPQTA